MMGIIRLCLFFKGQVRDFGVKTGASSQVGTNHGWFGCLGVDGYLDVFTFLPIFPSKMMLETWSK
jgi:hypothetical protein